MGSSTSNRGHTITSSLRAILLVLERERGLPKRLSGSLRELRRNIAKTGDCVDDTRQFTKT